MNIIKRVIVKVITVCKTAYYRNTFKVFGQNSYILKPLILMGHKHIEISSDVLIAHHVWLSATPIGNKPCVFKIGRGCNIGHYNHICATGEVIFEEEVLTADKVYISDHLHGYEDVTTSILKQPIIQKNAVRIGKGSWLGENVCIIGASVGKHCVIGANSVVTKDIPDYCVAVGIPAKVIKRYDQVRKEWVKVSEEKAI